MNDARGMFRGEGVISPQGRVQVWPHRVAFLLRSFVSSVAPAMSTTRRACFAAKIYPSLEGRVRLYLHRGWGPVVIGVEPRLTDDRHRWVLSRRRIVSSLRFA